MRTESEVLSQLLQMAQESERVRAVLLNGSRVNPNARRDPFCDYDVVFVTTDVQHFRRDQAWIGRLGELIIMQQCGPEQPGLEQHFFLMQFSDGVRIDLSFAAPEALDQLLQDSLTVVLLDKDGRIGALPPPDERSYFTPKPDCERFARTANEFWWVSTYVAKGLWRGQPIYARHLYEVIVRGCLEQITAWSIGVQHNWAVNPGLYGKWFQRYLPPDRWEALLSTCVGVDEEQAWEALFTAGRLFRQMGLEVAQALGCEYPLGDDQRVTAYLERVRALPRGTEEFPL